MHSEIYGLDFGTSNSAISIFSGGKANMIPIAHDGAETIPSLLFFPDFASDACIGETAIDEYVSSGMKGRLMQSIKSFLPETSFQGTPIGGRYGYMSIEHLVALIIADIKRRADSFIGKSITRVVMGRPVVFSDNPIEDSIAEARLIKAAQRAGFTEIYLQKEPIAAAFEYEQRLTADEVALIVDLGGGTSDFTIVKLGPSRFNQSDREKDILGMHGIRLGGNDFDSDLMRSNGLKHFGKDATYTEWHNTMRIPSDILDTLCTWQKVPLLKYDKQMRSFIRRLVTIGSDKKAMQNLNALIDNDLGYAFFQAIERVKCRLSETDSAWLQFDHSGICVNEQITRSEFEIVIAAHVEKAKKAIDFLLSQCNLSPADIDSVFTTGGTSYIPCIRRMLANTFGEEKIKSGNAFLSVATGLALSGKQYV